MIDKRKCNCPKKPGICKDEGFAFRKVVIPASLGDDVTGKDKPVNGAYKNSYVVYEANGAQYLYDSGGIFTKMEDGGKGTLDFNELENRPKYNGVEMTGDTDIPDASALVIEEANSRIAADNELRGLIDDEKGARKNADDALAADITAIEEVIPAQASAENQLADKNFVNSSVATNTAYYISDNGEPFQSLADLEAYSGDLTNNDYAFVVGTDAQGNTTYTRYKYNADTEEWAEEYVLNNSSFTADQWAAINSGITSGDVSKLTDLANIKTIGAGLNLDADGELTAEAGGETIFYANLSDSGTTRSIYKDADFTEAASVQDIIDANNDGQVILRGTSLVNPTAYSDSYLQNAFIMPHNNDYEFVFLDRDLRYEYTASATTDTSFYYDTSEIQPRLTAGTNINISGTTISATDTTYSNFTGTDGVDAGTAGLVPAPATTDAGKYLKADGTWDTVQAGPTVVQTTGNSQTDVMSQKAATEMIWKDASQPIAANKVISIGDGVSSNANSSINIIRRNSGTNNGYANNSGVAIGSNVSGNYVHANTNAIAIGTAAQAHGIGSIVLGDSATANQSDGSNYYSVAIGASSIAKGANSVALGRRSRTTASNTVSVGSGLASDASTYQYRRIINVADPTLAQDAATKNYTDNLTISYSALNGVAAPTTATEGKYIGQLYYDTTNEDMYYLKAITGTNPATYTWDTLGGGGGIQNALIIREWS